VGRDRAQVVIFCTAVDAFKSTDGFAKSGRWPAGIIALLPNFADSRPSSTKWEQIIRAAGTLPRVDGRDEIGIAAIS
jgi:hypothetical protein